MKKNQPKIMKNKMKFGILGNIYNNSVPDAVYNFSLKLFEKNIGYFIEEKLLSKIQKKYKSKALSKYSLSGDLIVKKTDFIISFGGDGTMLRTADKVGNSEKPILGVNLGKLGFLTETTTDKMFDFIDNILADNYIIELRSRIEALFTNSKRIITGLNEVVIGKAGSVQTIEIEILLNSKPLVKYLADGLILATPTGSTGYSMSAGGPIVDPKSKVFILSPICPHSLTVRPIIVPDDSQITVLVNSRVPIVVTADGHNSVRLENKAKINLRKAKYFLKLIKDPDTNYFELVNKKLLLGEDVRQKLNHKIAKL